jgi:putative membrane protein
MVVRWLFAALHLLALAIGPAAVFARGRALRGTLDRAGLARAFFADNLWGVAAGLWLVTGIPRLLFFEKGVAYYMQHPLFLTKLVLFLLIFALEVWPMVTLIRWRIATKKGEAIDTSAARRIATISFVQMALVLVIVFLATAVARGYWA